jgi:hypothetical protein
MNTGVFSQALPFQYKKGAGRQADGEKKEDNTMKRILTIFVVMAFSLAAVNCASWNKTTQGAVIGGAGGAVLGGVIGHAAGNTLLGAILGAAVGGAAGGFIGNYMDKQGLKSSASGKASKSHSTAGFFLTSTNPTFGRSAKPTWPSWPKS